MSNCKYDNHECYIPNNYCGICVHNPDNGIVELREKLERVNNYRAEWMEAEHTQEARANKAEQRLNEAEGLLRRIANAGGGECLCDEIAAFLAHHDTPIETEEG